MKCKALLIFVIGMVCTNLFAVDITLVINNKKITEKDIGEDGVIITVNRGKYKNVKSIKLVAKQNFNGVYKRTLQITGENENPLASITEATSKPGVFNFTITPLLRRLLLKQNVLKVLLAEDPANDMMKLPSKRKLLAEIHLK